VTDPKDRDRIVPEGRPVVKRFRAAWVLLAAAALAWGADFWDVKPYTQWSEKEVTKIMGDSPWAKTATAVMDFTKMREMAPPGGGEPGGTQPEGGDLPSGGGGGRGGRGGGGGMRGGGPPGGMAPMFELLVRWQSALTVRQALVRGQFGDEAATSEKAQEFLGRKQTYYVVAVSRAPMRFFQRANPENLRKYLAEKAELHVKGLETMKPADIQFQAHEQSLTIYFAFPRNQEITVEHKEVEFVAPVGPLQVKRKFTLAEMVRDGKLDL
jgi:hypothetical protein